MQTQQEWTRILKLTFKYIWTNHLSKNNKGCALVGAKTSKKQPERQQHNNQNFECLYSMFDIHHICVVFAI